MFAKIFSQIFDSSIAENYSTRHMFMDLLVLADPTGVVDMTHDAIARRTNVPLDLVKECIEELSQPDDKSRSHVEDGRRIALVDDHRDWGWQIVNYEHYRYLMDEEARRSYFRNKQREYRLSKTVKDSERQSKNVSDSLELSKMSTQEEGEGEVQKKRKMKAQPSSKEELLDYARSLSISDPDASDFWDGQERGGWILATGKPVKDWKAHLRTYKTRRYLLSDKTRAVQDNGDIKFKL